MHDVIFHKMFCFILLWYVEKICRLKNEGITRNKKVIYKNNKTFGLDSYHNRIRKLYMASVQTITEAKKPNIWLWFKLQSKPKTLRILKLKPEKGTILFPFWPRPYMSRFETGAE